MTQTETFDVAGTAAPSNAVDRLAQILRPELGLALLPGLLTVYLSFESGGYYPKTVAFAAVVLLLLLLARVALASSLVASVARLHAAAVVTFGLFGAWTLISVAWSDATDRTIFAFDRVLLYLLVLVVFGLIEWTPELIRALVRGLAAAMVLVGVISLTSRVLPSLWPTTLAYAPERLGYPLGYSNAVGLMAALGLVLALALSADSREQGWIRAIFAAAVPLLAVTLYLTFSRGAIAALFVGLVVLAVTCREWGLVSSALIVAPTSAVAVLVAHHARLLASSHPQTAAAATQGRHVALAAAGSALVAAAGRLVLLRFDRRIQASSMSARIRSHAGIVLFSGVAVIAVLLIAVHAPSFISRQTSRFFSGAQSSVTPQGAAHLTTLSNEYRVDNWKAALVAYSHHPVTGTGAGTYQFSWIRYGKVPGLSFDYAHSLYLETLSELGPIGLALLVGALLAIVFALARGVRRDHGAVRAALLAVAAMWLVRAGVDWDWEVPAVTVWFFAVGGMALSRGARLAVRPQRAVSVVASVGLVALMVVPADVAWADHQLTSATMHYLRGDCVQARREASSAVSFLPVFPQAYQIMGMCGIRLRSTRSAQMFSKAIDLEPHNWVYRADLAIGQAFEGIDPRRQIRVALHFGQNDKRLDVMAAALRTADPRAWRAMAERAALTLGAQIG